MTLATTTTPNGPAACGLTSTRTSSTPPTCPPHSPNSKAKTSLVETSQLPTNPATGTSASSPTATTTARCGTSSTTRRSQPVSVPTTPASWDILGEYEYATGNHVTISIDAPAPEFFGPAPGNLHWNGRNGWTDTTTGQLVAVLRHTVNTSQNELLLDAAWLENWLTTEQKSLIWVENTGKDVYRGMGSGGPTPAH